MQRRKRSGGGGEEGRKRILRIGGGRRRTVTFRFAVLPNVSSKLTSSCCTYTKCGCCKVSLIVSVEKLHQTKWNYGGMLQRTLLVRFQLLFRCGVLACFTFSGSPEAALGKFFINNSFNTLHMGSPPLVLWLLCSHSTSHSTRYPGTLGTRIPLLGRLLRRQTDRQTGKQMQ